MSKVDISLMARQYVANGWALVPIPPGQKFPTAKGWNRIENCVRTPSSCSRVKNNVGLAHAYSGTCVLDFDDLVKSAAWLQVNGLDFNELWNDPQAVRISSGRPNRGKLLFKLPEGVKSLRTHPLHESGLELRCASSGGATVQDVLPPSIHPDTGEPYAWDFAEPMLGDWRDPPVLPDKVLAVWQSLSHQDGFLDSVTGQGDIEAAQRVLDELDPDMGYHEWIRVGMALHHEFDSGYEGLELWDEWSSQGSLYRGMEDLEFHWRTFNAEREGAKATLASLESDLRSKPASPDEFMSLMDEPAPIEEPKAASPADDFTDLTEGEDNRHVDLAPVPKKPAGFEFQTVDEFLNRAPPSWIIKGLLPRASLGVMYGDSGAGKTFVALDQAMAVALGKEWRGAKTKQGTVAYIVAEGATGFQDRLLAYCRVNDVAPASVPIRVLGAAPDMMDSKKDSTNGIFALGKALRALGPLSVIYIDTYARVMGAGNENEAKDTNTVVANCHLLHRLTGAIVILIHHSGKDTTKGARGSGALRAAADVEYSVTKTNSRRTVKITKMKDGEDGKEYHFNLANVVVGMDDDGEDRTSCVIEHLDDLPSVAEQLADQPIKATSEVRARIFNRLAGVIGGEIEREAFIQEVRDITPIGPSGIESPNWKALITRPLDKMIKEGLINQVSGRLHLPKTACD